MSFDVVELREGSNLFRHVLKTQSILIRSTIEGDLYIILIVIALTHFNSELRIEKKILFW